MILKKLTINYTSMLLFIIVFNYLIFILQDILEFIENSPHGIIYFTFGSVSSMSTLPKHIKQTFIDAFAQVPQRILWKYDGEINGLPENIMTRKWFPQRDILRKFPKYF